MLKIDVVPTLATKKGACFDLKCLAFCTQRKNFWCFLSKVHELRLHSRDKANLGFLLSQVLPTPLVITSLKNLIRYQVNPQSAKPYILKKSIL